MQVSQVLGQSLAILKSRIGPLIAMFLLYFVVSIVVSAVFTGALFSTLGAAMMSGFSPDSAAAWGALGFGTIAGIVLFYVFYLLLFCAQMVSLNAMASPWGNPGFGESFMAGLRAMPTMLGLICLTLIGYLAFAMIAGAIIGVFSLAGDMFGRLAAVLMIPLFAYIGLRLSLMTPVIAMEGRRNPIAAVVRSWQVTKGNVLTVFLSILGLLVLGAVFFALVFGLVSASAGQPGTAMAIILFLLIVAFGILFSLASATVQSVLLGGLSDVGGKTLSEEFE